MEPSDCSVQAADLFPTTESRTGEAASVSIDFFHLLVADRFSNIMVFFLSSILDTVMPTLSDCNMDITAEMSQTSSHNL